MLGLPSNKRVPIDHYNDDDRFDFMMALANKVIDRDGFAERLRYPFLEL
ncbi:MAG: hypothetical protein JO313_15630 [Verrucomicrobia bacterium]|nr:hypothetical protein [Verrucomicrobiota bacterium]